MNIKHIISLSTMAVSVLLFGCNCSTNDEGLSVVTDEPQTSHSIVVTDKNMENNDLQEIIQMSIDLPKLQQYFHIEERPERSPLIIIQSELIPPSLDLNKFGKSVEIVDKASIENQRKAYIVFSKVNIEKNTGSVSFTYLAEGIRVTINFIKKDNEWTIKESELKEN